MMLLKKKQIDLLIRLQPVFDKYMGSDREEGDMYAFEVLPDKWRIEYHDGLDNIWKSHTEKLRNAQGYNTIRIPKAIDIHEYRGLWGMIKWSEARETNIMLDGELRVGLYGIKGFEQGSPFDCLLITLCKQENV